MNYCNKCGAVLGENDYVCHNCGEPAPGTIPTEVHSKRKCGFGKIIFSIIIIIFIITSLFVYNKVNTKSDISNDDTYMEVIHKMVNNVCVTQDPKELQSLFVPVEVDYYIKEKFDGDEKKLINNLTAFYDKYKEATSGGYVSATWEIREQQNLSGTELKAFRQSFQEKYHTDKKITHVKVIQINITAKTAKGKSDEDVAIYVLVYIDGKWYLSIE